MRMNVGYSDPKLRLPTEGRSPKPMKAIPPILVGCLMALLAIPNSAQDQCEMLRQLIAHFQKGTRVL